MKKDDSAESDMLSRDGQRGLAAVSCVLILMQGFDAPLADLDRFLVVEVQRQLRKFGPFDRERSRVDVWLDSPGGDAHAAFKLALLLDAHFETINFVVVDFAKSAATLLTLVGDAIYMGPCAELGPVDMQERREGEAGMRSALYTARAVEELAFHGLAAVFENMYSVLQLTGLSRETTVSQLLNFVGTAMRPLFKQIDPVAINGANTGLSVAVEYGVRLASYHRGGDQEEHSAMADRLMRSYPTHGFVIDKREAQLLGLPVRELSAYEHAALCENLYLAAQQNQSNIVRLIALDDLLSSGMAPVGLAAPDDQGADAKGGPSNDDDEGKAPDAQGSTGVEADSDQAGPPDRD